MWQITKSQRQIKYHVACLQYMLHLNFVAQNKSIQAHTFYACVYNGRNIQPHDLFVIIQAGFVLLWTDQIVEIPPFTDCFQWRVWCNTNTFTQRVHIFNTDAGYSVTKNLITPFCWELNYGIILWERIIYNNVQTQTS